MEIYDIFRLMKIRTDDPLRLSSAVSIKCHAASQLNVWSMSPPIRLTDAGKLNRWNVSFCFFSWLAHQQWLRVFRCLIASMVGSLNASWMANRIRFAARLCLAVDPGFLRGFTWTPAMHLSFQKAWARQARHRWNRHVRRCDCADQVFSTSKRIWPDPGQSNWGA